MKKMLLIVPSLHQGGLEKVCAATARLLQPYFDVQIAIFDSRNLAYDIKGIPVMDLHLMVPETEAAPEMPGQMEALTMVVQPKVAAKKHSKR